MQNLIVPMAGKGDRFLRAGYKTYKPFLKTKNSKTILDNITNKFDKKINIIFIVSKNLSNKYLLKLKNIENSKIIKIDQHKLGPGYSILQAKKFLKNLENIFVSYSDIEWVWLKKLETYKKNVIFCFKGYHPFTTDNNKYAFCKINNKFLKIKEKSSFTNN